MKADPWISQCRDHWSPRSEWFQWNDNKYIYTYVGRGNMRAGGEEMGLLKRSRDV